MTDGNDATEATPADVQPTGMALNDPDTAGIHITIAISLLDAWCRGDPAPTDRADVRPLVISRMKSALAALQAPAPAPGADAAAWLPRDLAIRLAQEHPGPVTVGLVQSIAKAVQQLRSPAVGAEVADRLDDLELELRNIRTCRPVDAADKAARALVWLEQFRDALLKPPVQGTRGTRHEQA